MAIPVFVPGQRWSLGISSFCAHAHHELGRRHTLSRSRSGALRWSHREGSRTGRGPGWYFSVAPKLTPATSSPTQSRIFRVLSYLDRRRHRLVRRTLVYYYLSPAARSSRCRRPATPVSKLRPCRQATGTAGPFRSNTGSVLSSLMRARLRLFCQFLSACSGALFLGPRGNEKGSRSDHD